MIGGLLKSTSRVAILAAAGMFVGGLAMAPAQAADLGGDCCADLEERVADLEATTVRKGNRKVSLKISGHVSRDFGWIEDEYGDSEFYSAGNGTSGSRIKFSGSAKLTSSWTAGYVLRVRLDSDTDAKIARAGRNGAGSTPGATRQSIAVDENYVYLNNATMGTFAFGNVYGITNGISRISLGGFGVAADNAADDWNGTTINGFNLEQASSGHQAIAYISPTIAGFTLGIAWADLDLDTHANNAGANVTGHDDAVDGWDIGLRYANEFGPIRVAAGIGYTTVDNDELGAGFDGANVMGSVALMHTPTGLNVNFSAGKELDGGIDGNGASDKQYWHVAGGINQNFFGPGNTSLYGEYGNYDYDTAGLIDDTVTMWGLGVVQHFDSAATELYVAYRHWDQKGPNGNFDIDGDGVGDVAHANDGDVDQLKAGMRIKC